MRRTIVFASFLVLALAVALASRVTARLAAQEATPSAHDPAAVHAAFTRAFQAGDPDAITALFAPNGILVSPLGIFRGPEEIRAFYAGLIKNTPGLEVTFTEPTVAHNTAVSRDPVVADPYREAGAERVILIHTIVASGGQIVVLTAIPAPDDPVTTELFAAMQATAPAAATPAS